MTALAATVAWLGRYYLPRVQRLESRIVTLERMYAIADVRYRAHMARLDQIEHRGERIEDKLDRLSGRL